MAATVTLVTGASTGLGQATALHLARKGHRVYATMRSPDRDGGVLRDAAAGEGLEIIVDALDVRNAASIKRAVDAAIAGAGRIDVLVNNAGIGDLGALELTTDEQMMAIFDTNVFGAMRMMRAVLPSMRARGSGTIVNISSVAGLIVGGGNGMYSATKHALEALSEALAIEVMQYGIRVAIIEPGFFDTPIIDKAAGAITADGDAPYANVERRMAGVYMAGKAAAAGDPIVVAETIERAISMPEPKLRYPVGVDAGVFLRERPRMTDEEYVHAFGHVQTDDEWFAEFMRRFPMPSA